MVKFVDEDKMTPVQKALEHARFELCFLDGVRVTHDDGYSYVIDVKDVLALIDEAITFEQDNSL